MSVDPKVEELPRGEASGTELAANERFQGRVCGIGRSVQVTLQNLDNHGLSPVERLNIMKDYNKCLNHRFQLELAHYKRDWPSYYEGLEAAAIERHANGTRKLKVKKLNHEIFLAEKNHRMLTWRHRPGNRRRINHLWRLREQIVAQCWTGVPYYTEVTTLQELIFGSEPQGS